MNVHRVHSSPLLEVGEHILASSRDDQEYWDFPNLVYRKGNVGGLSYSPQYDRKREAHLTHNQPAF